MTLVALKAIVFIALASNNPSGTVFSMDVYHAGRGFMTVHAKWHDVLGLPSYDIFYTQGGRRHDFPVDGVDVMAWKVTVGTTSSIVDFLALLNLQKAKGLYYLQPVRISGKLYEFQETPENYYLYDPNSDFTVVMNTKQSFGKSAS